MRGQDFIGPTFEVFRCWAGVLFGFRKVCLMFGGRFDVALGIDGNENAVLLYRREVKYLSCLERQ